MTSKIKTTGYKNDIQETTTLANIPALGDIALTLGETSKGTLMLKGGGSVAYTSPSGHTYKPVAKVQLFVAKSKRWTPEQRAEYKSKFRAMFLRDIVPESFEVRAAVSQPSEKFNSAGGTIQLRLDNIRTNVNGAPVHGSVVLSFRGSRDWPESRPTLAADTVA